MKPHPLDIVNKIKRRYDPLSKEEKQVRDNLKLKYQYKSMYVDQLESVLDYYHTYIRDFNFINLGEELNYINTKDYLISPELHRSLMEEQNKYTDIPDIYIFILTTIKNKGKNVIIYNYIKYPGVFESCLLQYMFSTRTLRDYSIFLDNEFGCDLPNLNKNYIKNLKEHQGIFPYNA